MTAEAAKNLQDIVPENFVLSRYPLVVSNDIANHPAVPEGYEDADSADHNTTIEEFGVGGMGGCTPETQIPHAEQTRTKGTGTPNHDLTTQYKRLLKIVTMHNVFNNPHLVIGTADGNYLIIHRSRTVWCS